MTVSRRTAVSLLAATMLLAACGGGDDEADTAADTSTDTPPGTEPNDAPAGGGITLAAVGTDAKPGLPAITKNALDPQAEPTVAAGTGDAPTTLIGRDILVGQGDVAKLTDSVAVRYVGTFFESGKVFDASWKSGAKPITFPLSGVVPGFAQGIAGMKVGGRRQMVIPPELGYGPNDNRDIPGGSTLVFVVDLIAIV